MLRLLLCLCIITLIAATLRYFNLSLFSVYPDSYQNLLVAENLRTYESVLGFLGQGGMLYPDFFMWTRPFYALVINFLNLFLNDPAFSARIIAYIAGVFAIPLAYITLKQLKGKAVGFAGAFILALSYIHTVWSGFIMTETMGVFMMLLFLWSLFSTFRKKTSPGDIKDTRTGVLFAAAVLTRYEYLIIILALFLLLRTSSPQPYLRFANIFSVFLIIMLLAGITLYPLDSVFPVILRQLTDLLIRAGIVASIFIGGFVLFRFIATTFRTKITNTIPYVVSGLLVLTVVYLITQFFFGSPLWPLWSDLSFIRNFMKHEILISIFSIIGFLLFLKNPKERSYAYFALLSSISLLLIYHRINPDMERYLTHILPFLLIPASIGLASSLRGALGDAAIPRSIRSKKWIASPLRGVAMTIFVALFLVQMQITANGLRYLNDPSWYRLSYEEKAAKEVEAYITADTILLASTPEPYYFNLRIPTQSLSDTHPYIYIPDDLNNKRVLIIEDMGMHDHFPTFGYILSTKLQKYKKTEFWVKETYHTSNKSQQETHPVVLYEINLGDLKKALEVGLARSNK